MAISSQQKVSVLQGLSQVLKALVDGAAKSSEQVRKSDINLNGIPLPRNTVKPANCGVCNGKKK